MRTRTLGLLGLLALAGCGPQPATATAAAEPNVTGLRYVGQTDNIFLYMDEAHGIRCYAYRGSGISCVSAP
jgi:hypothetical protein